MANTLPDDDYVAMVQNGYCKVCGPFKDLRCGACYQCAPQVGGRPDGQGGHILWDSKKPTNTWRVRVQ